MAKTIKFNLICDGKPVRTLDDLKNNFSIEDITTYYNNKLLQRWLFVRGYNEELKKVEKIQGLDTLDLVKKLIEIFEVEVDLVSIEENTYILKYNKEKELLLEEYKKLDFKVSAILDDYHVGYWQLIESIIENKNDMAKMKAAIKEIIKNYPGLYEMDYRHLFYELLENAPMAIFIMLMNESMRNKYLPLSLTNEDGSIIKDIEKNADKKEMYRLICNLVSTYNKLPETLGENLKSFAGVTDGYWKDVETNEKKYMILKMESGNFIRSAGVSGGDLGSTDINNNFIILDGIDYKSNSSNHKLLYMEV